MDRRRPILDETNPSPPILRTAIAQAGQLIGFLEIPCYYGVPNAQEQDVIMFLADVACLIMKRNLRYMDTPDNMRDFFICDLLEGRETDERLIRERCRQFNWELSGFSGWPASPGRRTRLPDPAPRWNSIWAISKSISPLPPSSFTVKN